MARITLYGVYVYEFSLVTEAEKEEFKKYNKESIVSHISRQSDRRLCYDLARQTPSSSV
jgi:hypothetical protein